jgi:DNA-binding CsgD family transcriptional regulator/tetratricopeptide (TPR) repeat protein
MGVEVDPLASLTPRQRDILALVARGLTNAEIAGVLGLSAGTVRTHLTAILARLEVTNRTEAAMLYARAGGEARVQDVLERPAIAVWPFEVPPTQRPDDLLQTVAFGLTEDLIVELSRWTWFPVVRAAAPRAGPAPLARFSIRGGARREGEALIITTRVEDEADGAALWAERFQIPARAVLATRDAIVHEVVARAYPRLLALSGTAAMARARTEDASAWQLGHAGLWRLQTRHPGGTREARALLERASTLDPSYPLAPFGLGLAAYAAALNQWEDPARAADALAAHAARTTDLAPDAAEGAFLTARHAMITARFREAIAPLRRAIRLNPSFAPAHALLGQVLMLSGEMDEGERRMAHAERLGPGSYVAGLALARFAREDYPAALAAAEDALVGSPRYVFAHALAVAAVHWMGRREAARARMRRLRAVHPDFCVVTFSRRFGVAGSPPVDRVLRALAEADDQPG